MAEWLDTVAGDLETMLQGEWSEAVTINTGSVSHTGEGVFDLTFQEVNLQTGLKTQSKNPRVSLYGPTWETALGEEITDDVTRQWVYTIRGINYKAKEVQPDGTGWVVVYLSRARNQ